MKSLRIPQDQDNNFDLTAQRQIAEEHEKIREIKSEINLELSKVLETNVEIK